MEQFPRLAGPGSDVAFDPNHFETVRPGLRNIAATHKVFKFELIKIN